jgi:hypothetical protein
MIDGFVYRIKSTNMLLWIAILLLLDSGLALWNQNRIEQVFPRWNVRVLAMMEAVAAGMLVGLHAWWSK